MLPSPLEAHRIRPAGPPDALCIGVLGIQVFLDTYATEGIRPPIAREVLESLAPEAVAAQMAAPAARFFVAERHGHLVGFAQLSLGAEHALSTCASPAELNRLYVQERFTRLGIGAALLRHAEAEARGAGADALWLTVWAGNTRALGFYPRHGYRDGGPTTFTFQGETHENRWFVKPLLPAEHAPLPTRGAD